MYNVTIFCYDFKAKTFFFVLFCFEHLKIVSYLVTFHTQILGKIKYIAE